MVAVGVSGGVFRRAADPVDDIEGFRFVPVCAVDTAG